MDRLGYDIIFAVFFAGIVNRKNIRMLQAAHHLGLVKEHLPSCFGLGLVVLSPDVVDLDSNIPAVIGIVRENDSAVATPPEIFDYLARSGGVI